MKFLRTLTLCFIGIWKLMAQPTTFTFNGAPDFRHTLYALTGLTVFQDDKTVIENGVILIKDGRIVECGKDLKIPEHAVRIDMKGLYAYPSFIDLFSHYGIEYPEQPVKKPAAYWNVSVLSHENAVEYFKTNKEKALEYRKAGFGAVLSSIPTGIFRGQAFLITTDDNIPNMSIIKEQSARILSFNKKKSPEPYPSSLTGCIALIRQVLYDAKWYELSDKKEKNISLEAWNRYEKLPVIFEANDKWNIFRAKEIADEFKTEFIYKTSGNEYQRIHELSPYRLKYIVPLNFPEKPVISDPLDAKNYSLAELKHWEMAPLNPYLLEKHNQSFCFTYYETKSPENFFNNLRIAMQNGLSHSAALRALTSEPAKYLGMQDVVGSLKKGMMANLLITTAKLGDKNFKIIQHWIRGVPYSIDDSPLLTSNVTFSVSFNNSILTFTYSLSPSQSKLELKKDTQKVEIHYQENNSLISFQYSGKIFPAPLYGYIHLKPGKMPYMLSLEQEGKKFWYFINPVPQNVSSDEKAKKDSVPDNIVKEKDILYPFSGYGLWINAESQISNIRKHIESSLQTENVVLIRNATVWTNEDKDSILENHDILIESGKIKNVGKNIPVPSGARIIDAKGKHVTPGIIDEHSHIAIFGGVNEGTQASSAEVRMGDVINPDDINIFRNLAGGVTAVQLLHGSANPIGGQSGLIKLRWGLGIRDMKIENAPGFIKFALGENVKQSNWGDQYNWRFPQTRMGVEQVYVDYFTRAKEYRRQWKEYEANSAKCKGVCPPPRKDLELEAIAEILEGKRYITCHSYVQSEINMLMKVADSMGFKVNTFTHILEGYKVADKMKKHGACASTFSDWWAYKNEVMEAIPYNAALLTRVGVVTGVNSDDAEMSRRLNHEAAKAIRYGNLSPALALRLVTLHPAKMLHLDHRMGKIQPGMDADLVIWSGPPLSVYSRVEKTFVDGIAYYDIEKLDSQSERLEKEKQRIVEKILRLNEKDPPSNKNFHKKGKRLYHCNTLEFVDDEELEHIR